MQVSSDEAPGLLYFVATSPYLGDKRTAYARQIHFALSTFNASAPVTDVITGDPGDDVIIRGHPDLDFSLVARLPYSPTSDITYYSVGLNEKINIIILQN